MNESKRPQSLTPLRLIRPLSFLGSFGIGIMLLFLSSCGGGNDKKGDAGKADSAAAANDKIKLVETVKMAPQVFNNCVEVQGRLDADENVSVNAEMAGTVSRIYVKLGDEVSQGQVLAELDGKVLQQGMAELQSGLDLATTAYEKQKNLWDQKIGTEMQYLQAKTQKESLEKKMATLNQQLEMTKMKSPIKGTVDAIDIKLGQATAPGMPAIRVVNMCSLKVKGEVAESYAAKIHKGNEVEILFPDLHDSVKAKISYAARVISPLNRTFTVTVDVDCIKDFHPNMIAIMKIVDYTNPKALVVPVSTIQKAEEGDFVFICENKKAKKARVKVGKMYKGNAEIIDGLKEGDLLITKGFQELNQGQEIKY